MYYGGYRMSQEDQQIKNREANREVYQHALNDEYNALRNLMRDVKSAFCRILVREDDTAAMQYVSDGFCKLVDMSRDDVMELCGEKPKAGVYPEDREIVDNAIKEMDINGGRINAKFRLRHGSKEYVKVSVFGRLVSLSSEIRYLNIYVSEVAEQNQNGEPAGMYDVIGKSGVEYRPAFEQLKLILDCIPGGLATFEISAAGVTSQYISDGIYELSGYTKWEEHSTDSTDALKYVYEEDLPALKEQIDELWYQNRAIDATCRIHTADGGYKWINLRGTLTDRRMDTLTVNVVIFDVTEKKLSDEANRIYEEEMRVAMSQVGKMICEYDPAAHTLTIPKMYADWYGLSTVISNIPYCVRELKVIEETYCDTYIDFYESVMRGEKSGSLDIKIKRIDGTWHWEHYEFVTIFGDDGYPIKAILSVEDTTEQHETKQRYEYELQLRHELISDCVIYYKLNLTTNRIEEYLSKISDVPSMKLSAVVDDQTREEILNNIAKEDQKRVRDTIFSKALRKAYERGKTDASLEYRRRLQDREMHWVRARASVIKEPSTNEIIAFLYIRDINLEKKNQMALNSLMGDEIESICILNVKDKTAHMPKIKEGLSPYGMDQVFSYHEHISELIVSSVMEEDQAKCVDFFDMDHLVKNLEKEQNIVLSYRVKGKDGQTLRKRTKAFYLDETHEDIILSRRDITILYEEEQRQKEALQEAVEIANKANHAKSDFISRMSHDMRTPLNAILAFSGHELTEDATEKQKDEYLEKIHASGEYLLGIINDVLDMSRIESRKMVLALAPYSFETFKDTIETVIGEPCKQKGVHFNFEVRGEVCDWAMIDRVRVEQIFVNLLSNAVKFTPSGGTIDFIIEILEYDENHVFQRFTVRDNGIGMSKEFLPHAFESFAQEERKNVTEHNQGTGLGLSIVKQTVELMGGTITIESELDKGTTFVIELKYDSASAPIEREAEAVKLDLLSGRHVLLCEDNPINEQIIVTLLGKKNMLVDCAGDGEEGLNMFRKSSEYYYDTILMDKRMPVMDGLETAKAIRALERKDAASVPIIALTADAFVEDEQVSFDAGMNGHLSKPIDPGLLYKTLVQMVMKRMYTEEDTGL